jgi:YHS domain-containing protein
MRNTNWMRAAQWGAASLLGLALACGVCGAQKGVKKGTKKEPATPPTPPRVCPVKKTVIEDRSTAPRLQVNSARVHFCCEDCIEVFKKAPQLYRKAFEDPVTGKWFKITPATLRVERGGALFLFSSEKTKAAFDADPEKWIRILQRTPPTTQ